jgi:UPF0755 protein
MPLMIKRDKIALLVFVLLLATTALWLWYRMQQSATTPGASTTIQRFEVAPGSSMRSVLHALESQQLISDARMLEWYLRCCQRSAALAGSSVKAGRYRIVPGQPPIEIVRQLVEGKVLLDKVTIPEGWTFAQMRAQLAKQPELRQTLAGRTDAEIMEELGAPGAFVEGRFAPDTYSYASGITTDMQILTMAYTAQQRNLEEAWSNRSPNLPLATPDEALTLASIVEKETGLASERARIAGVYINRLRIGMRLQADPTVIYGMGERYDGNLRRSDMAADTPYNTYTRTGLPPTPIALPGREAIIATLHPEKNNFLYFVALLDGSGGHDFSSTDADHMRAVARYKQRYHDRQSPPAAVDAQSTADKTPAAAAP